MLRDVSPAARALLDEKHRRAARRADALRELRCHPRWYARRAARAAAPADVEPMALALHEVAHEMQLEIAEREGW